MGFDTFLKVYFTRLCVQLVIIYKGWDFGGNLLPYYIFAQVVRSMVRFCLLF